MASSSSSRQRELYYCEHEQRRIIWRTELRAHRIEIRAIKILLRKLNSALMKELVTPSRLIQSFYEIVTAIFLTMSSFLNRNICYGYPVSDLPLCSGLF